MVNYKPIRASWVRELVKPFHANAPFLHSLETSENLHTHVHYRKLIIKANYTRGKGAYLKKFPLLKNILEIKIYSVVEFTNLM